VRCMMDGVASRSAMDRSVRLPDEVDAVVGDSAHAGRDCAVVACDSFQVRVERLESFRRRTALREPPPVAASRSPSFAMRVCSVGCSANTSTISSETEVPKSLRSAAHAIRGERLRPAVGRRRRR